MTETASGTGSTLDWGANNKTSTAISTNILIMVGNHAVGAIQKLQITESRQVKMVDEVGTDGHIDSVPTKSTDIKGSCTRVRFDKLRIAEAFSRGFVHVASQAYPFDIVIIDKQKRDTNSQIATVIKNVWITQIDYTYDTNDWIISDNMSWEAETIWSVLNSGSPNPGGTPVAVGGEIGITHAVLPGGIEQITDTGNYGRRGSLDAAGLIDIGSSGDLY